MFNEGIFFVPHQQTFKPGKFQRIIEKEQALAIL